MPLKDIFNLVTQGLNSDQYIWCINSEAGGLEHAHRRGFKDSYRYTYSLNKKEAVCDIKPQLKVEFFGRMLTWVKTE